MSGDGNDSDYFIYLFLIILGLIIIYTLFGAYMEFHEVYLLFFHYFIIN